MRLVIERHGEYENEYAAIQAIAAKLRIATPGTLRRWICQAEVDAAQRPGVSSEESAAKTLNTHFDEGLDFLGWRIQRHRKRGTTGSRGTPAKVQHAVTAGGDKMNEADDTRYIRGYIRLWATLVIAAGFGLGAGFIVIGTIHGLSKTLGNLFQSVGAAVVASLILYVLVSIFIDPRRQMVQARETVMFGVQAANRQFAERFEVALPAAVFEGSNVPKRAFRNAFVELVRSSTRYDYKGDSANFTTYRLARCFELPEIRRLDQIRLCMLDPRHEDAVKVYAEQYLYEDGRSYNPAIIAQKREQIKNDVYVSLWTLYQLRHELTISVFFHGDMPFFRCELFDKGMFLTYYLDRRVYPEYPETLQFSASTRPFRAYSSAMAVSRTFAPKKAIFGSGSDAELINNDNKVSALLMSLGCRLSPDELNVLQKRRFSTFDKWLGEAGLRPSELF